MSKCSKTRWCKSMDAALNQDGCHSKGLSVLELTNFHTSKRRIAGVIYRTKTVRRLGDMDGATLLSVCPFCSESINWLKREEEPSHSSSAVSP